MSLTKVRLYVSFDSAWFRSSQYATIRPSRTLCHARDLRGFPTQVTSFSTHLESKRIDYDQVSGTEGWDENDFSRWENSLRRDFTINGYIIIQSYAFLYVKMHYFCRTLTFDHLPLQDLVWPVQMHHLWLRGWPTGFEERQGRIILLRLAFRNSNLCISSLIMQTVRHLLQCIDYFVFDAVQIRTVNPAHESFVEDSGWWNRLALSLISLC